MRERQDFGLNGGVMLFWGLLVVEFVLCRYLNDDFWGAWLEYLARQKDIYEVLDL